MIICPQCKTKYADEETFFCGRCGADMRAVTLSRQGEAVSVAEGGIEPRPTDDDMPAASPSGLANGIDVTDPVPKIDSAELGSGASGSNPEDGAGDEADALLGTVVDGRYRVLERIGMGGMGVVYRCEHVAMGKLAAMKVLHPSLSPRGDLGRRFRREAEAVSRLSHPNIVQVFDFGQARGLIYLVMELVKGEDLGSILKRDKRLSFVKARPLLIQLCDALEEAHAAGIVHRDIKPENLLVSRTRDGRTIVKVLDFGLAKLRDTEESNEVTSRGSLVGTPYYMSPEQIRGEPLDGRSDIYAVGALMYRLLTGTPPFGAPTPIAVLTQHLNDPLEPPSERAPEQNISPELDAVVARAMSKKKDERFADAQALRDAILAIPVEERADPPTGSHRRGSDPRNQSAPSVDSVQPLRREEIDAYERKLKWQRLFAYSIVPLLLIGLGVGGWYWYKQSQPAAVDIEREPNNTPSEANLIDSGRAVRGHVGEARSFSESDRDYYHFKFRGERGLLSATVTGLPTMELKLELYDGAGTRVAEAHSDGKGDGAELPNVRLAAGDYYLCVRELWVSGKAATSDPVNWYSLTATFAPLPAYVESEPNDSAADAIALPCDRPERMKAFFSSLDDVDHYVICPELKPGSRVKLEIQHGDQVDFRAISLPNGASLGENGTLPPGAKVVDHGAADSHEPAELVAGQTIALARKPLKRKGTAATGSASAASSTVPYEIGARQVEAAK